MQSVTGAKILRVDLTRKNIRQERIDPGTTDLFLGGPGLGAKILFDEVAPGTPPFDPANNLIFMTGPLTGTPAPAGARYGVVFKSPQTGGYGEATAGGKWGPALKWAGYDGIVVEGRAESPSLLLITDEKVEIREAPHLWGKDTQQTEFSLQQELGKGCKIACIGPAGENRVPYAAIINDFGRVAARTGPGAVMGSKNLKAIAVMGGEQAAPGRQSAPRRPKAYADQDNEDRSKLPVALFPGDSRVVFAPRDGRLRHRQELADGPFRVPGKRADLRGTAEQRIPPSPGDLLRLPRGLWPGHESSYGWGSGPREGPGV